MILSTTSSPSLSVAVPALNEEATLQKTVTWTLEVLANLCDDYEIVIIDDGSTDSTGRLADELGSAHPAVKVVHNASPTGYGGALNAGFLAATKDVVTIIPADCEFWPTELPRFVDAMVRTGADVVSSTVPNRPMPRYRNVLSWGWRVCMRLILGECPTLEGIFMMRRSVFTAAPVKSRSGMWAMELLIRARRNGARFAVIPMDVHPRADMRESKVANVRTVVLHFLEILDLKKRLSAR